MSTYLGNNNDEYKALRVCLVTETYPPAINGVENSLFHYVKGLAARNHGILVIRPSQTNSNSEAVAVTHSLVLGMPIPFYKEVLWKCSSRLTSYI